MRTAALVMAMALLGPTLSTSEAAPGHGNERPDALLYELTEHAVFENGARWATSALEGSARRGSALCPEGLQTHAKAVYATAGIRVRIDPRCRVVKLGNSELSLTTFGGEINGNFWVVVNSDATNLIDAQGLVVMYGTFTGKIQVTDQDRRTIDILPGSTFTPTSVVPGFPLPLSASFTGKFRVPFTVHGIAVYESDRGRLVPVLPNERALGDPTVRLEIGFD
jgi:hypothetical protein